MSAVEVLKIIRTEKNVPGMTKAEIDKFLGSGRLILRLGTNDVEGGPAIHPVWYYYSNDRLYLFSGTNAHKMRNVRKSDKVYFTVDTDAIPNKGVRGKGKARIVNEASEKDKWVEKIVGKYLDASSPMYNGMIRSAKSPGTTVLEIRPEYYAVWDYSKMM